MKKIISIVFSLLVLQANAQTKVTGSEIAKTMGLEECIQMALQNNLTIKQTQLTLESENVRLSQAKTLNLPTVNGFTNLNANAGRNVDPFSNAVVTRTIGTNNLGVQASMPLYDGYKNKNTLDRSKLSVEAALVDVNVQKNNIALQVAVAYLNVLSTEDLIDIAQKQIEATNIQMVRTQKLVKSGAVPETNLFDLEAQLANDELNVVNAINNFETAKLTLRQAMNIVEDLQIIPKREGLPSLAVEKYDAQVSDVYKSALSTLPEIKAGEIRNKIADKNIEIAKSQGLPTVSVSSSWGTAYSSVAKNLTPAGSSSQAIPVSAEFQGQTVPFVINFPQAKYTSENIPYFNQIGNNQNVNIGVGVRIPIFNGYNTKYQTQGAKIQKLQTELQNESTKLQIKQNIDQAYINMLNAQKKYTATQAQVLALEKSFKASETRYSAGSGTFVDYNLAKTNLDRAKSSLIISKYDYIFRTKILDFYQNKPLSF
jgi:outer membrane protein